MNELIKCAWGTLVYNKQLQREEWVLVDKYFSLKPTSTELISFEYYHQKIFKTHLTKNEKSTISIIKIKIPKKFFF